MKLIDFYKPDLDKQLLDILNLIIQSGIEISMNLRNLGLDENMSGLADKHNSTGDDVKKFDLISNEKFINNLMVSRDIYALISEELENPMIINDKGKYIITVDPLDGSGNIDVNITTGTIFSILPKTDDDVLRPGKEIIMSGYIMYSSATIAVIAYDNSVQGFTLNLKDHNFYLSYQNIKIPEYGTFYSINEGYTNLFDQSTIEFLKSIKDDKGSFKGLNTAAMVADIHRMLFQGGIFLYPANKKRPNGKIRLMIETNPMSFLVKSAGGDALADNQDPLEIKPTKHDQQTPIVIGSIKNIAEYLKYYNA